MRAAGDIQFALVVSQAIGTGSSPRQIPACRPAGYRRRNRVSPSPRPLQGARRVERAIGRRLQRGEGERLQLRIVHDIFGAPAARIGVKLAADDSRSLIAKRQVGLLRRARQWRAQRQTIAPARPASVLVTQRQACQATVHLDEFAHFQGDDAAAMALSRCKRPPGSPRRRRACR